VLIGRQLVSRVVPRQHYAGTMEVVRRISVGVPKELPSFRRVRLPRWRATAPANPVFNRTITLKDAWAKEARKQ